jgi:hypothetical protein
MPSNAHPETTLDTLAALVKHGFEKQAQDLEALAQVVREFKSEIRESFKKLEPRAFVGPHDREDLEGRVSYIEKTLGIQSGK